MENSSNRVLCKVVECLESSVVIEMSLSNGEILREMDGYMYDILVKLGLSSIGSKFYYTVTGKDNGINITIEPYLEIKEICLEVNNLYDELETTFKVDESELNDTFVKVRKLPELSIG